MSNDLSSRATVAGGTFSPPVTRRGTRAAKKAKERDGNIAPRRESARAAPEEPSTAPTRARSTRARSSLAREKGTSRDPSPSTPGRPASRDSSARVDTPRPSVQSAIYRDRNGIFRVASPQAARELDCPPTPRAGMPPPPPFPGARHGIAPTDGRRGGTRAPKIADENVARQLDVFRLWASVNSKAEGASRLPWAETFTFIASRDAFVEPRPATSEKLKDRVKTVAHSMAHRRGLEEAPSNPQEFVDFFGGALEEPPKWAGALDFGSFPFDKPKKTPKRRRVEEQEDDAFDEPADEDFDAITASPPPAATPPPPTPSSPPAPPPVIAGPPPTPTPTPRPVAARTPRATRETPATSRRASRPTPAAPRRAEAEEEDAETLARKERDCLKKGKLEEAREFQADYKVGISTVLDFVSRWIVGGPSPRCVH